MEKLHGLEVAKEGGFYGKLVAEAKALIDGEDDLIANAANVASLVFHALNERRPNAVNWVLGTAQSSDLLFPNLM